MQDDDNRRDDSSNWRQEGPEAIARRLAPTAGHDPVDESLWLALNAWG
jgi:hypothetical protein